MEGGTVPRRILVLLDSPDIAEEVPSSSLELALRMEAELHVLMLLRTEQLPDGEVPETILADIETTFRDGNRALEDCLRRIRRAGVEADGAVRQGDPASELLKYLAESKPFQAVVWGGNERFLRGKNTPVRTHWLERVRKNLDCPLVVHSWKGRQG